MRRAIVGHGWLAAITLGLGVVTIRSVLAKTGGEPAAPLDDTYIHFQFARSFAELRPFEYTPGAEPAAGTTSLLWPLVLALFYSVGFQETALLWPAWILGFAFLGALAHETRQAALGLVSKETAIAAALMIPAFGAFAWFAASGMEVVPFAWLLMRTARRVAEWSEGAQVSGWEIALLGFLGPLVRPEGILASALALGALVLHPRARSRTLAAVPMLGPLLPAAVYWAATGSASSTTATAKWLPLNPYFPDGRLTAAISENVQLLFGTLLDGRLWSAVFVPAGAAVVAWAALLALPIAGFVSRRPVRAAALLVVALGMLLPATYETFLVNRLRYLWPFAPAWIVGCAALAELLGLGLAKIRSELRPLRLAFAGIVIGAFAGHLSYAIDDLATSADAVRRQQVDLGRWARAELPEDAIIGVNDTGAIAYYSGRRVFDVVGLTTRSEGRYWVAGAGSRFEHYERVGETALPTHFIVYPEWFQVPPLLDQLLTDRSVTGATILGGPRMVAYSATYRALASGHSPRGWSGDPVDRFDVADLESEAEHDFALLSAARQWNVVEQSAGRADGARTHRTVDRFRMRLESGVDLVARLAADAPLSLSVHVDGAHRGDLRLAGFGWEEVTLGLGSRTTGDGVVEVRAPDGRTFTSMHYWIFRSGAHSRD